MSIVTEILGNDYKGSEVILDAFVKADSIINNDKYKTILVSVSGGKDSDLALDICWRVDKDHKCKYAFIMTGLEYTATREHIKYLTEKYEIEIETIYPKKPIPVACREFGLPFVSKMVSEAIESLQAHDFPWKDMTYEEMLEQGQSMSYAKWFSSAYEKAPGMEKLPKIFNIDYNKGLREFLLQNPPDFKISKKCCTYAKKKPFAEVRERYKADVMVLGIHKGEGGVRDKSYKSCFTQKKDHAIYAPLYWFGKEEYKEYEKRFGIKHSDCYEVWGLDRTGCGLCPYNLNLEKDMKIIEKYDPNIYKAGMNIFGKSIEYTREYKRFQKELKHERN